MTRAILKLFPRQDHHRTLFAALADLDHVNDLYARACLLDHGGLTAFELVPESGLAGAVEALGVVRPLETQAEWYLLARFSGSSPVDDTALTFLSAAVEAGLLLDAVVADTAAQEENLWQLRDELPPETLFDAKGAKFDAAVPIDRVAEFQRRTEVIARDLCAVSYTHLRAHET